MKALSLLASTVLGATLLTAIAVGADAPDALEEHLEALRPFVGRTWRGEFKNSRPDRPMIDIARWERALNGKAVRVLHSINDGFYGGESLIVWDKEKAEIRYHYFSTGGFHTVGTMTVTNGIITAVEKVFGSKEGVTEVRSTYELRPDGTLLNSAEYLKGDQVTSTREVLYREDPKAEVKFK